MNNKKTVNKKIRVEFSKDGTVFYIDCDSINRARELKKQLQKLDGYTNIKIVEETRILRYIN